MTACLHPFNHQRVGPRAQQFLSERNGRRETNDFRPALLDCLDAALWWNSSGENDMADAMPEPLRPRFLGPHFFNPPRYLRLLEIVPHAHTDAAVLDAVSRFGEEELGKGVVVARDTPDFIANRIGCYWLMSVIRAMLEGGYTVEEADALTGPVVGRPLDQSR